MHFKGMLFDLTGDLVNSLESVEATWGEWAVVTADSLKVATAQIKQAGLSSHDVSVTSECIQLGKPDAKPFLVGAIRLGISPQSCIAFCDSDAGMISARRADCMVVKVLFPDSYS